MLSPFTLTFALVVPLIYLTIFPLAVLSSLSLLFYLTITCMSSPPLIALTRSFFLVMLFVFSLCLFVNFSYSHCFVLFFPQLLPPPHLYSNSLSASHLSLPSSCLVSFPRLYSFTLFPFSIPLLLLVVLGNVHQAYWHRLVVDEFCHDYTHAHTDTCVCACTHRPVGDGG